MSEKVQLCDELPIDWNTVTPEDAKLYLSAMNGVTGKTRERLIEISKRPTMVRWSVAG